MAFEIDCPVCGYPHYCEWICREKQCPTYRRKRVVHYHIYCPALRRTFAVNMRGRYLDAVPPVPVTPIER